MALPSFDRGGPGSQTRRLVDAPLPRSPPPPHLRRLQGDMYPKGSPKFNLVQAARGRKVVLGAKQDSPKITKRDSLNVLKSRAQWNLGLEKALVEILLEHNTPYHRGRNGWNGETWNRMLFGSRINRFKSKPFPLFNLLGDLYDGHTAEGHYNFTSTAQPSQIADVTQIESEAEEVNRSRVEVEREQVNRSFSHLLVK